MSNSWDRITLPLPRVTHGKELRLLHLELLMGQNYVLSLHVKCP